MQGQEDHEKKRRRQRFWILAAIIVLVIRTVVRTVLVAVTIPGSSNNNTDDVSSLESQQGKSNETTAPTFGIINTPTMNPTTPPPSSVPGMDNSTLDYVNDGSVLTKPTNTAKFQEDFLLALQLNESSYLGGSYPPDSYMGKALQWILEEDIFPSMK